MVSPKKKVTLYFTSAVLGETHQEAIRQDRSISWIMQAAWRLAREEVRRLPDYRQNGGEVPSSSKRQVETL
jgi:uncharacterized small protein (TIGR04563 family)